MSSFRSRPWDRPAPLAEFEAEIEQLVRDTRFQRSTIELAYRRGLRTVEEIRFFLNPDMAGLTPPSRIRDLERAAVRLADARERGERIRIYGDYDVDGTTGAALFSRILRSLGFTDFDALQPDRFKDGYGLKVPAVEDCARDGVKVLVTIDNGIVAFDAIARARELGIDTIVVDHHQLDPERGVPTDAYAVVNPQRADCESGRRELCGCALGFYLGLGLRAEARTRGWFAPERGLAEPNFKQHLDLVVLATAADMVPLTGDNHILARHGLEVLKRSQKPGLRALLEIAGLTQKQIKPSDLGFAIGPRINASGRMANAGLALELLTTDDERRAAEIAVQIERLNLERQETQNAIWDEVRAKVEAGLAEGKYKHAVVVADPGWHEGVVGIVASRVTETFQRPAIVMAVHETSAKGSVRSFGGRNVLEGLRRCSALLTGFGGHAHAAGVQCLAENLDRFAEAFDAAISDLDREKVRGDSIPPLKIELEVHAHDLTPRLIAELQCFGPFGPGNPEPLVVVRGSVRGVRVIKERHLKFGLGDRGLEAMWFHAAETDEVNAGLAAKPESAEFAGVPELNHFRGAVTPTLRVRDWRNEKTPPGV